MYILSNTYETFIEANGVTRPIRIEVFKDRENSNIYRARIWDQTTYNLYPTLANIEEEGGLQNKLLSCDELNREITNALAEAPSFVTGKEYSSEEEFVNHIESIVLKYQALLNE